MREEGDKKAKVSLNKSKKTLEHSASFLGLVERSVANGLKEYYDNLRLYLTQEIERLDYKK